MKTSRRAHFVLIFASLLAMAANAYAENSGNPVLRDALTKHDSDIKADLQAIEDGAAAERRRINDTLEMIQTEVEECKGSWSQKLAPAGQRFALVLDNQAVLDKETCLVWQRAPSGFDDWANAHDACFVKEIGGRLGWRLPTIEQLSSLLDPTEDNPALPLGHPFENVSTEDFGIYWTSTTVAGNSDFAWIVQFGIGFGGKSQKTSQNFVWCVRGGQGYDAY